MILIHFIQQGFEECSLLEDQELPLMRDTVSTEMCLAAANFTFSLLLLPATNPMCSFSSTSPARYQDYIILLVLHQSQLPTLGADIRAPKSLCYFLTIHRRDDTFPVFSGLHEQTLTGCSPELLSKNMALASLIPQFEVFEAT